MEQSLVTGERVIQELKKNIAETLRINAKSVTPEASLVKDLGAESLDFLDINYRLEKAFGIRMARHFILEHVEEMFGEGSVIDENSQLTEKGAQLLRARLGDQNPDLKPSMDMDQVPLLVSVQSLANAVMDILRTLPDLCTKCDQSAWKSEDGTHIQCGSCGESAVFTNGDELIKKWLRQIQEEKKIF